MAKVNIGAKSGYTIEPPDFGRPGDSELFMVYSTTTRPVLWTRTTTALPDDIGNRCNKFVMQYTVIPGTISALCFVFGILYCFFGYRYFKATMFMTGFIFGSVVTYLICLEENLLPIEGKIGVAIGAGVLCGLITMLVQYVGLFMTGFHLGFLLAVGGLVVTELFRHPNTKWIPIGAIFGTGLVFALLGLYFQRSLTIVSTSVLGSALMLVSLDYFVEMFIMLDYVLDRLKAIRSEPVCWFSWIIIGLWPVAFFVGLLAQCRVTGKGFNHHEVVHRSRQRKVNLQQRSSHEPAVREPVRPNAYRHLYQIRRFNGDVIAQNYVCGVGDNVRRLVIH